MAVSRTPPSPTREAIWLRKVATVVSWETRRLFIRPDSGGYLVEVGGRGGALGHEAVVYRGEVAAESGYGGLQNPALSDAGGYLVEEGRDRGVLGDEAVVYLERAVRPDAGGYLVEVGAGGGALGQEAVVYGGE